MEFKRCSFYIFEASKEEIELLKFERFNELLTQLKKLGKEARSTLFIMFNGYEDIPEEALCDIPDILKWFAEFVKRNPELFYFLSTQLKGDRIIASTLSDGEGTKSKREHYKEKIDPTMHLREQLLLKSPDGIREKIIKGVRDYGHSVNDLAGAEDTLTVFKVNKEMVDRE